MPDSFQTNLKHEANSSVLFSSGILECKSQGQNWLFKLAPTPAEAIVFKQFCKAVVRRVCIPGRIPTPLQILDIKEKPSTNGLGARRFQAVTENKPRFVGGLGFFFFWEIFTAQSRRLHTAMPLTFWGCISQRLGRGL